MLVCPLCRNVLAKGEAVCPRDGQTPLTRELQPIPAALAARFAIVEPFGEGDAGSLYLVDDKQTGRRGLLKLLRGASAWTVSERSRLKRELVKQATLTHPALVVPLATGEADNCVWLFREWIDGVSLSVKLARSGAIAVPEALAIAAQIASALDELHRAGLLMRDLSPGHVLVAAQPSGVPKVSLIDAGVAMRVGGSSGIEITGKPAYISPEHASGKLVSFRSDLYSLGCVIHEMLTGHPVFRGTTEQLLEAQRTQPPGSINAPLPSGVASLIAQLLVKEPRDRPFSAQQVRRALEPFLPEDAGGRRREPTAAFSAGEHARPIPDSKGTGTLRPAPRKQTLVGFAVPKPGADRTEELSALDLADAERALGRRSDATQELSSLDLGRAERVLGAPGPNAAPPPRFRRDGDPTMPLSPADLAASRPGRNSAPPPPVPAARPKTAPPPPPAAAKSVRPPPGAAAVTTSPGIAPTPEPAVTAAASTAGDLDYEDLAETTALEREEAHALVDGAAPAGAGSAQAALAPTLQAFPASPEPAAVPPKAGPPASASSPTPAPQQPSTHHVARAEDDELAVSQPRRASRMPLYVVGGLIGFCVLATGTGLLGTFVWTQLVAPVPIATQAPTSEPAVRTEPVGSRPTVVAEATPPPVVVPAPAVEPVPEPVPEPAVEPVAAAEPEPAAEPVAAEPEPAAVAAAEPAAPAAEPVARTAARGEPRSSGSRASSDSSGSSGGRPQIASTFGPRGATAPAAAASGPRTFDQLRDDARAAFQARRYADAARAYEQASRMRPRDAAVWAGLGAARLQGGNARSAIEAYRRAVSLEPRNVRYHVSIGRAFAAAGDRARARQAFEHALSLDPRNRDARTQLGRL